MKESTPEIIQSIGLTVIKIMVGRKNLHTTLTVPVPMDHRYEGNPDYFSVFKY
jgi:hypothetical protein